MIVMIAPVNGFPVSADALISDERHHAGRHVVQVVAVEWPASGIVRVEGNGHASHRREENSVAQRTAERLAVNADHLECVAVQMHRVSHHRHVRQCELNALSPLDP